MAGGETMTTKTCGLWEALQPLTDPRRQCANLKHLFHDILVLGFCGTLAGCEDFVELAAWASEHEASLRTFLALPNGIPSHDTFNRVFALVSPRVLQEILVPWLHQQRGLPGSLVHIDGKAMRRTRSKAGKLGPLYVVSAWASEAGLTLGQVSVDEKSNEITAIPELLPLLDLQDKIVTIDAAGCQKNIAQDVVEQGGDYVLAVKDNQPTLHAEVAAAFAAAAAEPARRGARISTEEEGHGRREKRTVCVLSAKKLATQQGLWAGLTTLVLVLREITCQTTGVISREVSYYISSLKPNAKRIGHAIRGHWSIENGLHWVLDVVFKEDARRLYDRQAAANVAFLNRLALSLLRGDSAADSLKVKRKRAGWSMSYLMKLLGF
jgi:predicted transposase YbfD/YdcC